MLYLMIRSRRENQNNNKSFQILSLFFLSLTLKLQNLKLVLLFSPTDCFLMKKNLKMINSWQKSLKSATGINDKLR